IVPAQRAPLTRLQAGEVDVDDVAGGANGGVGIEVVDERPSRCGHAGRSHRGGGGGEGAAARDLFGNCFAGNAHAPLPSPRRQLLRAMNSPSTRRNVSASPEPCGSSEAFAAGSACASMARRNACILASCRAAHGLNSIVLSSSSSCPTVKP